MPDIYLQHLHSILDLAKKQQTGHFTPESDARMALSLIEQLAKALIDEHAVDQDLRNE